MQCRGFVASSFVITGRFPVEMRRMREMFLKLFCGDRRLFSTWDFSVQIGADHQLNASAIATFLRKQRSKGLPPNSIYLRTILGNLNQAVAIIGC